MCGICGELRFDGSDASLGSLQAMTDAMVRRGPDSSGVVTYGSVGFGHRRLSIIDLRPRGGSPWSTRSWAQRRVQWLHL